jgi:hypothetical protein
MQALQAVTKAHKMEGQDCMVIVGGIEVPLPQYFFIPQCCRLFWPSRNVLVFGARAD